jgi:CheY-like chemotaxis protein
MAMLSQQSAVVKGADVYERSLLAEEAFAPKQNGDAVGCISAGARFLRVLVADDNLDVADSVSMPVRMWGHEVQRTYDYDGTAILKIISSYRPDVILLDIAMPEMEGCRLARLVREQAQLQGIFLIAMTECADETHRLLCDEAGFDHILKKPIERSTLEELLRLQRIPLPEPTEAPCAASGN